MFLLVSLLFGVLVGTISGMIGLGGAVFLIPILVYGYGMDQKSAQGTSHRDPAACPSGRWLSGSTTPPGTST